MGEGETQHLTDGDIKPESQPQQFKKYPVNNIPEFLVYSIWCIVTSYHHLYGTLWESAKRDGRKQSKERVQDEYDDKVNKHSIYDFISKILKFNNFYDEYWKTLCHGIRNVNNIIKCHQPKTHK